jgi:oxalate decarboxylase
MESISRRDMLAATAAGGLLTAASVAAAQTVKGIPQPRRPDHGGTDPGPRNLMRDGQNPDVLVPPATDHVSLPNLRFSFSDGPMRLETGGWTRQLTARDLGVSKNIASVNLRLNRGGVRELHWHEAAEWAYMLYGNARITAVDAQGGNFVDDVGVGDLWYYADLSLDTWLALTPPELLQAHLKLDRQVVDALRTNKTPVVPATFETETGKPGSPCLRPPAEKRI